MLSRRTLPMVLYLGNVSRRRNSCNAKIKVRVEQVVGNVNTYNHAADPCRKETLQIKNAIKRRAIDTDETAQQIISTAVTNCSEAAAAQLPPLRHIRRGSRRVKKDAGNTIPVTQNLQTMEIPEEYSNPEPPDNGNPRRVQ